MNGPIALLDQQDFSRGPAWLGEVRRIHGQRVRETGLPGKRDENWKYTSLRALESARFEPADGDGQALAPEDLASLQLPDLPTARMVLVNGRFAPQLSQVTDVPGLRVRSLAGLGTGELDAFRTQLEREYLQRDDGFWALNTALAEDGLVIEVAENCQVEMPLELLALDLAGTDRRSSAARHLVKLAPGAQLTLIERHVSLGPARNLSNQLFQITLGARAELVHLRLQQLETDASLVTRTDVDQAEGSGYRYFGLDLGGGLVRHDINVCLGGRNALCDLSGVYLPDGDSHVDNHTRVDHVAPGAISQEWFKGVLDGQSRAVFNGKVVVHEGADGTDARQSNANLLLSDDCEVDTKPELEIYADDVKCAHGATVGQLDEGQMFYLRSRGIDEATARELLTRAFCIEVLGQVENPALRAMLEKLLDSATEDES